MADAIERAQTVAQSGLLDYLWEAEQSLVNRLVASHRAGKLADRDAAVGVAVISEIRNMQKGLELTLIRGEAEAERLTQPKE